MTPEHDRPRSPPSVALAICKGDACVAPTLKNPDMFDLENALAAWRRSLQYNRAFDDTDRDELERHVRDQVAALCTQGLSERDAFHRAVREMGDYGAVEQEYRKVYWGKRRRRREVFRELTWRGAMLANYVKIALRNLKKQKGYAFINVPGLAVGMACCLLIVLYVQGELGYDRFHEDASITYRVNFDYNWNEQEGIGPGTPPPLAARLAADIPEVAATTRLYPVARTTVRHDDVFFNESRIISVDADFFSFFDFKLTAGDAATALAAPNSVILTEATAHKYFGDANPVGQLLTIGEKKQLFGQTYDNVFRVTGLVEAPPPESHIQFDLLTSMASHPEVAFFDWSWIWMQMATYVKLRNGVSVEVAEAKIPALVQKYAPDAFERVGFSYEDLIAGGGRWDFVFQPLTNVYLSSVGNRLGPTGNRTYVYVFLTVGLFTLLIACINFMNLATAQSTRRACEVGVRKALGSPRRLLVGQFLVESLTFSLLALPPALLMVYLALGPFNQLSGKTLAFDLFSSAWLPLGLVLTAVLVGVVAGSYPGFYLSSFRPVQVLKGKLRTSGKSRRLRHGLVVFQFAMTISLIACTLLVQQQMDFVRRTDLGFERDGLVIISNLNHPLGDREAAFKAQLENHADIRNVSISTGVPPRFGFEDFYKVEGRGDEQFALISYMTDEDLVETLGIDLVAGRNFAEDFRTDARSVVLNETAVNAFGWKDPIGKTIDYPSQGTFTVIGVMKDFNYLNLRAPIAPFALFHSASQSYDIPDSYVVVRIDRMNVERSLDVLQAEWETFAPGTPFAYTFLDESFNEQYLADFRLGRMFLIFSMLTIFIACLGLLGLSAFTAEQRTKEIGVRKVLGASAGNIVVLLSKEFTRLVALAVVLGIPFAYLAMHRWLAGFAYHVELSWPIFLMAGLIALGVALLTVGYQSIKAALADPVKSLRYE